MLPFAERSFCISTAGRNNATRKFKISDHRLVRIKKQEESKMPNYIVNKNAQSNGDHEVHETPRSSCTSPWYPEPQNQVELGWHVSCSGAVTKAKFLGYTMANGCYYCSRSCHTG